MSRLTLRAFLRPLALCTATALAAACGDTTAPALLDGTYQLSRYDGVALPIPFDTVELTPPGGTPTTCVFALTGMRITVADDHVSLVESRTRTCADGSAPATVEFPFMGTQERDGDRILITVQQSPVLESWMRGYARHAIGGFVIERREMGSGGLAAVDERDLQFVRTR